MDWLNLFLCVKVTHEQKNFSDHCHVLLVGQKSSFEDSNYNRNTFKFEEAWTKEAECGKLVKATWDKGSNAQENLKRIKEVLLASDMFNLKKS